MADFYDNLKSLRGSLSQKKETFVGDMGIIRNGQILVNVPNRPPFVYVRLRSSISEPIKAYNDRVVPAYGIPVEVEFKDGKYIVLGRDSGRYTSWPDDDPFLPAHGRTHIFDNDGGNRGKDPVWVYPYQIIPGLVSPMGRGKRSVYIHPFVYDTGEGFKTIGGTGTAALNKYAPSTSGTVLALIYGDAETGNPGILLSTGTWISDSITGTHQLLPYLPEIDNENYLPLGFVRLVNGTSEIGWNNVYDIRQPLSTKYPKTVLDREFVRKFSRNIPPTANDDSSLGYLVTDEWFDISTGIVYKSVDVSLGNAVWVEDATAGGNGDFILRLDGALAPATDITAFVVTRDTSITKWYITADYLGITGSTIVDIKYSGTTIFSDPSDRPTLDYNDVNSWASSATPQKVDFVEGDILTFDIAQAATSSEGLSIVGQNSGRTLRFNLTVEEDDGTPSVSNVAKIIVPNGSLTDDGGGQVSISTLPDIPSIAVTPSGTLTTTSSSFADVDGANMEITIVKQSDDTDILLDFRGALYSTGVNTDVEFALREGSTDHVCHYRVINPANSWMECSSLLRVTGLSAGSRTFRLRWRRASGSGTLTTWTSGRFYLSAQEVQ